jgi:hypothetical protein
MTENVEEKEYRNEGSTKDVGASVVRPSGYSTWKKEKESIKSQTD